MDTAINYDKTNKDIIILLLCLLKSRALLVAHGNLLIPNVKSFFPDMVITGISTAM